MIIKLLAVVSIAVFLLTGCTAGPNPFGDTANAQGYVAGFFIGLWHGIIFPFAFFASLFLDGVSVYEVHNTGGWYNFGYLIGLAAIFEGGGTAARSTNRNDRPDDVEPTIRY